MAKTNMIERAIEFINEHGTVMKDQTDYLKDVDWRVIGNRKNRAAEYKLHLKIVNSLIDKMEYVIIEAGTEEKIKNEKIKKFIEVIVKQSTTFNKRISNYFVSEKWQNYTEEQQDEKSVEIDLQNDMLQAMLKVKKRIAELKLDEEVKDVVLKTYGNAIISLPMRNIIEERYPEVKDFVDKIMEKV